MENYVVTGEQEQQPPRSSLAARLWTVIGELENATDSSGSIDIHIRFALEGLTNLGGYWAQKSDGERVRVDYNAPAYTGSVDAALKLIPPYFSFELTASAASAFTRARLWDWRRSPTMSDPGNEWKSEGNQSLAISICIAALKARADGM